jgi:hypothetical protein
MRIELNYYYIDTILFYILFISLLLFLSIRANFILDLWVELLLLLLWSFSIIKILNVFNVNICMFPSHGKIC